MATITLENLSKFYDGTTAAVRAVNLSIADDELLVLVGASGCGKSTLLRLIAGLETPTTGCVKIAGQNVNAVAPSARNVAMVFQNYALYPQMTAFENMAFALKMRGVPRAEIAAQVAAAAELLRVQHLLTRRPAQMSGGECQRVALGRALVRRPAVFLLDEPLSGLDAPLRQELCREIMQLRQKLTAPMVYVTHAPSEALTLGQRLGVMRDGVLLQVGTPTEIFSAPKNCYVAQFIGTPPINFFHGEIVSVGGQTFFIGDGVRWQIPAEKVAEIPAPKLTLGLRPRAWKIGTAERGNAAANLAENFIDGEVEFCENHGDEIIVNLTNGAAAYRVIIAASAAPKIGETLRVIPDLRTLNWLVE